MITLVLAAWNGIWPLEAVEIYAIVSVVAFVSLLALTDRRIKLRMAEWRVEEKHRQVVYESCYHRPVPKEGRSFVPGHRLRILVVGLLAGGALGGALAIGYLQSPLSDTTTVRTKCSYDGEKLLKKVKYTLVRESGDWREVQKKVIYEAPEMRKKSDRLCLVDMSGLFSGPTLLLGLDELGDLLAYGAAGVLVGLGVAILLLLVFFSRRRRRFVEFWEEFSWRNPGILCPEGDIVDSSGSK